MTGPIIFNNDTAREQLIENGVVTTFRTSDRTTGATWWRETRTGPKRGDCHVTLASEVKAPLSPAVLEPWADTSGFEGAVAWLSAIRDVHGDVDRGYIYRVTEVGHGDK